MEPTKQFIGPKEVKEVIIASEVTPASKLPILKVIFVDGSSTLIPKITFDGIVTSEPIDATKLKDKRVVLIAQQVLNLFADYDLKLSDFELLHGTLKLSIDDSYGRATRKLWGTDEKSMLDVDRVLVPRQPDGTIPTPTEPRMTLGDVLGNPQP